MPAVGVRKLQRAVIIETENAVTASDLKKLPKKSGNVIHAEAFDGQQLLDAVAMVPLQFYGVSLYRSPAGEFSFHEFRQVFEVNVGWVEPFNHGDLFSVTAFIDLDIDPLLFLCYLLTDT